MDPADVERARPFMERLERFLAEKVDSDRIDREGQIPPEVIQGLRDIGAFGIKIPQEYGGLGLSQTAYTHAIGLRRGDRYLLLNPLFHCFADQAGCLA